MAVRLRMAVHGVRNSRIFHLVAVNQRQRRNAKPIELLGVYNPRLKPGESTKTIEWSVQRIQYWLNVGATPSKTVTKLLQMVRVSCCRYMSAVAHDDHRAAFSHPNARCRKPCPLLRHHHQRPSHSPLRSFVPYDYLHMSIHIAQEAPDVTDASTPTCGLRCIDTPRVGRGCRGRGEGRGCGVTEMHSVYPRAGLQYQYVLQFLPAPSP